MENKHLGIGTSVMKGQCAGAMIALTEATVWCATVSACVMLTANCSTDVMTCAYGIHSLLNIKVLLGMRVTLGPRNAKCK